MLDHIRTLPKPGQDLADLQAKVDCLLKENGELKAKADEGESLRKEMGELKNRIAAVEEEVKTARVERDKVKVVAQNIHGPWLLGISGRCSQQGAAVQPQFEAANNQFGGEDDALHGGLRHQAGEDAQGATCTPPPDRIPTGTGRYFRRWTKYSPNPHFQSGVCNSSGYSTGPTAARADPGHQHGGSGLLEVLG